MKSEKITLNMYVEMQAMKENDTVTIASQRNYFLWVTLAEVITQSGHYYGKM